MGILQKRDYPQAKKYIDLTLKYSTSASPYAVDSAAVDSVMPPEGFVPDSIVSDTAYIDMDGQYAETDTIEGEDFDINDIMSAEVLSHAGDIYFMSGLPEQALEFWERAALIDPDDEMLARKVKYKTYFYDDKKARPKGDGRQCQAVQVRHIQARIDRIHVQKTAPSKQKR